MEGLALGAGQGSDALGRNFVENAIDFGLVGWWGGGTRNRGTLRDVSADSGQEAAQMSAFKELVDIQKSGKCAS